MTWTTIGSRRRRTRGIGCRLGGGRTRATTSAPAMAGAAADHRLSDRRRRRRRPSESAAGGGLSIGRSTDSCRQSTEQAGWDPVCWRCWWAVIGNALMGWRVSGLIQSCFRVSVGTGKPVLGVDALAVPVWLTLGASTSVSVGGHAYRSHAWRQHCQVCHVGTAWIVSLAPWLGSMHGHGLARLAAFSRFFRIWLRLLLPRHCRHPNCPLAIAHLSIGIPARP